MESVTLGYVDSMIITAGNAIVSYDLGADLSDIRDATIASPSVSEFWYFGSLSYRLLMCL